MVCNYSTIHWYIIFQTRRSSISAFQHPYHVPPVTHGGSCSRWWRRWSGDWVSPSPPSTPPPRDLWHGSHLPLSGSGPPPARSPSSLVIRPERPYVPTPPPAPTWLDPTLPPRTTPLFRPVPPAPLVPMSYLPLLSHRPPNVHEATPRDARRTSGRGLPTCVPIFSSPPTRPPLYIFISNWPPHPQSILIIGLWIYLTRA